MSGKEEADDRGPKAHQYFSNAQINQSTGEEIGSARDISQEIVRKKECFQTGGKGAAGKAGQAVVIKIAVTRGKQEYRFRRARALFWGEKKFDGSC